MRKLGIVAWFCISVLAGAFLRAWSLSLLWRWFETPQYGLGPSMGAWFGLSMIVEVVIVQRVGKHVGVFPTVKSGASAKVKGAPGATAAPSQSNAWGAVTVSTGTSWLLTLFTLGISWIVGSVLGWI